MDKTEYIIYLKEEYSTRRIFECSKVDITSMGVVICQLAHENKKYMIPLSSIYYIRILEDEEIDGYDNDDDGGYGMPSPLEPLFKGNLDMMGVENPTPTINTVQGEA